MGRGSRQTTNATQLGFDGSAEPVTRRAAASATKRKRQARQPKAPAGQGSLLAAAASIPTPAPAPVASAPLTDDRNAAATKPAGEPARARRTKETAPPDFRPDGPSHRKLGGLVELRVAVLDGPAARTVRWLAPPLTADIEIDGHLYTLGRRRDIGVVATHRGPARRS